MLHFQVIEPNPSKRENDNPSDGWTQVIAVCDLENMFYISIFKLCAFLNWIL